ncbi:MAG: NADH-quinone oxidoreductase subunit L [Candidatus Omnitrophota bacterium]|nr:NADH-quinone oxidoreductase subunit L [Candidatus Omnitrophota bacterium]
MVNYAYLIPLFPLLAFAVNIFWGRRLKAKSAPVAILAMLGSLVISCLILKEVITGKTLEQSVEWFKVGRYSFEAGFLVDPLSAMMLCVVTLVGLLVEVYSIGYMRGDKRYHLFFAYVSLFIFSMLGLVLSNNLIQTYVFWELVGVCSYLLISFWFEKKSAADAGKKAFITNRIGDAGFFLGLSTLFYYLGTANFTQISQRLMHHPEGLSQGILALAAVLIFCGAVGKSAQFPLHVWLPDAMEGPTPVSALIHAATMVAAGVYLVARSYAVFAAGHLSLEVVSYIGIITSFMAGSIALVQTDIKRILAYSTVSQLGYMMIALGVGGYSAGVFHLMTHAFFKALLFLCAGSVIHACGVQDIRQMGGLFGKMKVTATTCLIGCLAISGVPPLSGFWSKDEILLSVYNSGNRVLYGLTLIVAFMTAFYMFRLLFLTFFGKPREKLHIHKPAPTMDWPLIILAVFSIFSGFVGSPLMGHAFSRFIYFHPEHTEPNYMVMISSVIVGLAGISLAWVFYILSPALPAALAKNFQPVYNLLLNKYWIDEIYDRFIIQPFLRLTKFAFSFDRYLIDGAVNLTGTSCVAVSRVKGWIDKYIVDGLVNLIALVVGALGEVFRRLQTGLIQNYILLIFTGVVVIVFLLRFI